MKVTTKTGDKGETVYKPGVKISKGDERIAFVGSIDELQVAIGGIDHDSKKVREQLLHIQKKLFDIHNNKLVPEDTTDLEKWQDELMEEYKIEFDWNLTTPKTFRADYARIVARKVERMYYKIGPKLERDDNNRMYLNRLSDYLWVVARTIESVKK